ncbi:MAG: NADH-quinone oxidoreductase subunit NuoF [Planctomycetes bacterium]|nr:NADH-quinone oxidoreductase subunit NuoF [Planctomycetota bacterium]
MKSLGDLTALAGKISESKKNIKARVLICMTGCRALGAELVANEFREKLSAASLDDSVEVVEVGCIGMCAMAPLVLIEPYDVLYGKIRPKHVDEIISATIEKGEILDKFVVKEDGKPVAKISDVSFYKQQQRQVLGNCGRIDPRQIDDAIEKGGYVSAVKAITETAPDQIIEDLIKAGLRGRGGAGFPAGLKWKFARQAPGDEKYLICNADEGDPGAFMDRALLEGDPHKVIEGMLVAAYAIGASHGLMYVRAEYPIAVEHVKIAIVQAREYGLLGGDIAGSGFSFDLEVRMGAGAFVCGEETALIGSLEGKRGMPTPRPPFPATCGYKGKPTNINNVETFANVPLVLSMGPDGYSSIGTEKSKGTKIFALAGKVKNTGLVEVPMGATLRQIVYEIGGGIPDKKEFKGAQLGGPSGGCIPAEYLDYPIDYDSLQELGAIMGSGGLIVMDEDTCMVDIARYFLDFTQSESCGKCTPCRVGTAKMLKMLEAICRGEGKESDLDELERLGEDIRKASLCGLGQTAPNPVLSTLRYFRDEYLEHIREKTCRSGVCKDLLHYVILDVCVGCGACKKVCPVDVIAGEKKQVHTLDQDKCIKCGQCYQTCKFKAISR